jgi:hypothetical protein
MEITTREATLGPAVYLALSVVAGMVGMAGIGGLAAAAASTGGDGRALDIDRPGHVQIVPVAPDHAGARWNLAAPMSSR